MIRQLIATAPERVAFGHIDLPAPTPTQVRVRSRWGAAKHGTEMALFKGYAGPRGAYDGDLRLFDGDRETVRYPSPLGNMCVGEVIEVGTEVTGIAAGDLVSGHGPFRQEHVWESHRVRRLPDGLVNRIAAGEVIERPAAVVKELVENAIDAGAARIDVALADGGQSLISVTDDGHGMSADELALAVERHVTSKLANDDLSDIRTLGFRGEALPSIGAVSRLALTSRARGADQAWTLAVEGGRVGAPAPAALGGGTRVEARDLFFATPARLKFMKSARAETAAVTDVVNQLAMAHPEIAFTLASDGRAPKRFEAVQGELLDARLARLARC